MKQWRDLPRDTCPTRWIRSCHQTRWCKWTWRGPLRSSATTCHRKQCFSSESLSQRCRTEQESRTLWEPQTPNLSVTRTTLSQLKELKEARVKKYFLLQQETLLFVGISKAWTQRANDRHISPNEFLFICPHWPGRCQIQSHWSTSHQSRWSGPPRDTRLSSCPPETTAPVHEPAVNIDSTQYGQHPRSKMRIYF